MLNYIIALIIRICILFYVYNTIIYTYFVKNDTISYDIFLYHFIHNVSKDNYFMNYGLWDNTHNTLIKANENLVDFVFNKTELANKKDMNVLDVGCGYGQQDLMWSSKLHKTCKLTAVDISEKQIVYAKEKNKAANITFEVADALTLNEIYKNNSFDTIICLESAFHYSDRPKFFKNVSTLLKYKGRFVISDITLKDSYVSNFMTDIFIRIFSDFLHVPNQNLIKSSEWESQLSSEFKIIEINEITEKVFNPYYKHFIGTYIMNMNLPKFISNTFIYYFQSVQPFSYKVAVLLKN